MYAMMAACFPFTKEERINALHYKSSHPTPIILPVFNIPADASNLILRMLTVNPDARITMDEILAHPFLSS